MLGDRRYEFLRGEHFEVALRIRVLPGSVNNRPRLIVIRHLLLRKWIPYYILRDPL